MFNFHQRAGKTIPEAVQWIVIRLGTSTGMSVEDVAMYTAVDQRTVKKILTHFRRTGEVISLCVDVDVCRF